MKLLLQCRPGFESEACQEVLDRIVFARGNAHIEMAPNSGFAILDAKAPRDFYANLHWKDWIFVRQWWCISATISLDGSDRLTPMVEAARDIRKEAKLPFGEIFFEEPDTNDGRQSTGFAARILPLLEDALHQESLLDLASDGPRFMVFFADEHKAYVGTAGDHSTPWPMGFPRLRFPAEAPSRSTLKLAEAFEVFLSPREQDLYLRSGMHAVDLGAAPGGWTWQLVTRGMHVDAVDNGPLKGAVLGHPSVKHWKADGFRFRPQQPVDWLVCDMVEQPRRIAELICDWFVRGNTHQAIFNLKLQQGRRLEEVRICRKILEDGLEAAGLRGRLLIRQLYHDREEVTVYLRSEGKSKKTAW
jgi:23S rRNA (cytidine2498-2'-O)-methyltransferase